MRRTERGGLAGGYWYRHEESEETRFPTPPIPIHSQALVVRHACVYARQVFRLQLELGKVSKKKKATLPPPPPPSSQWHSLSPLVTGHRSWLGTKSKAIRNRGSVRSASSSVTREFAVVNLATGGRNPYTTVALSTRTISTCRLHIPSQSFLFYFLSYCQTPPLALLLSGFSPSQALTRRAGANLPPFTPSHLPAHSLPPCRRPELHIPLFPWPKSPADEFSLPFIIIIIMLVY